MPRHGQILPLPDPPAAAPGDLPPTLSERKVVEGDRDILNAYLTSLFNAWVNNHSLDDGDKRWVVAFAPRLAWGESRDNFFRAYPDGHLIAILRNTTKLDRIRPRAWDQGSRQGRAADHDVEPLNHGMIDAKQEELPVSIVRFEDLVRDAAGAMRMLARSSASTSPTLIEPTFNSRPIGANFELRGRQGSRG